MSMYPIATTTAATSGVEPSFLNIPQGFTHLQLRIFGRSAISSASVAAGFTTSFDCSYIRFNGDATPANYADHKLYGDGSAVASAGASASISALRANVLPANNAGTGYFSSTIIDILEYSNTNKTKTVKYISGIDANGSGISVIGSGLWVNTAAITNIFVGGYTGGHLAGTRFDLYGVSTATMTGA